MAKTAKIRLAFQSEKPVSFWFLETYYWVYPGPKWTTLDHDVALALKEQLPTWFELYSKTPAVKNTPAQP